MTLRVLVPDEVGVEVLAGVDGVDVEHYDDPRDILRPDSVSVFVPRFLSPAREAPLEAMTGLRMVQLLTAGHDGWTDVLPAGVLLSSCHGAHGRSTAEWVLAVMLADLRSLPFFLERQSAHEWRFAHTATLADARVLVIGAGDVGQHVKRLAEPFGADVTLVGRTARDGVRAMSELHVLLGEQDVVVLAVPLTTDTRRLGDAPFLSRLREGALLVNAARGPVVDTDALVSELATGRIRAAIDVVDPEPLPADHPLWSVPGLILTPHVGASITDKLIPAYRTAGDQISQLVRGEVPSNVVAEGGRSD